MTGVPPPQPSAFSAISSALSRAVPYEDFEEDEDLSQQQQQQQQDSWLSWISQGIGLSEKPAVPTCSYRCLAEACDYREKVSNLKEWAQIRRLKPKCQVYQNIVEYVNNSKVGSMKVTRIFKIERKNERPAFTEPHRIMLWHGTRPSCIPGIIQNGFEKGSFGMYGGAIYLSDRIRKSQNYAWRSSKGTYLFVLAEVDPGRVYNAHYAHKNHLTAPDGFDSVKATASHIPDPAKNKLYHGAVMPSGPTVRNTRHGSYDVMYNGYILYDANRVIVRFVVECSH